jgi:hypothetical protein
MLKQPPRLRRRSGSPQNPIYTPGFLASAPRAALTVNSLATRSLCSLRRGRVTHEAERVISQLSRNCS